MINIQHLGTAQWAKFLRQFGRQILKRCEKLAPKFENSQKMAVPKFQKSTFLDPKFV